MDYSGRTAAPQITDSRTQKQAANR